MGWVERYVESTRWLVRCYLSSYTQGINRRLSEQTFTGRIEFKLACMHCFPAMLLHTCLTIFNRSPKVPDVDSAHPPTDYAPFHAHTTHFGDRSFAAAGPRVWSSLPAHLHDEASISYNCFRPQLKSSWFQRMYSGHNATTYLTELYKYLYSTELDLHWTFHSEPNMRHEEEISNFGNRAFAAAGPELWRRLPSHLKEADLPYNRLGGCYRHFWGQGVRWTVLTLWCPLLPHRYSYKATCARLG